ncbi:MAG TPA: DUF3662 and FHA domain-containing protein [Pseudonocardiaceae bacterium]|jgi:hypothetical protein|nr:DUF3662 and FHA domain-containing protein [Pseudonocardiaceae bacterium]
MGKAQRFERRLQGMVGDAFARVFGGSVVPQEVAQALQREADDNARPLAGGRVLAPNRYTVTLGATDHDRLAGDEQRVIRMLKDCVQGHLREQAWDVYGDVVVALKRSATLHTGQFRTSSSVDPDAPQPRTAGDRAMTQHAGEYPDDGQRGQYGGRGHDQGQGGHQADPNVDQPYGYDFRYLQDQSHHQNQPNQNHGNQGYDAGYGQGQPAPAQGYQQTYGDPNYGQYGGGQPGYGYDQGGYGADQNYGGDQNYGYRPPAVQAGPRQLAASLTLDDGSNRHYQLAEGSTTVVGRGQDAQFRLPDTGVSRRHVEITWDGRTAILADLGSTNGTTVNGTPVQTWQLADGDVVRLGHSSLVFRTQG